MKISKALMIQGTGPGVGKSVLVAAFGRILKDMGLNVAPFKAQNMALNSYVTAEGLEMGRAQVYQAEACGLQPDVRMNPILLKPSADNVSQVILLGRPDGNHSARDYYRRYLRHRKIVKKAYGELASEYEVILIEGAGSPAEINLQHRDLVNMQMAHYAKAKVLIVGDIDRGGVFAWMKGTYDLIQDEFKPLISGFLINKFRGDRTLLEPGIRMFEKKIRLPVLGVVPYFRDIWVDEEDAIPAHAKEYTLEPEKVLIGVIVPPRIREPLIDACLSTYWANYRGSSKKAEIPPGFDINRWRYSHAKTNRTMLTRNQNLILGNRGLISGSHLLHDGSERGLSA